MWLHILMYLECNYIHTYTYVYISAKLKKILSINAINTKLISINNK